MGTHFHFTATCTILGDIGLVRGSSSVGIENGEPLFQVEYNMLVGSRVYQSSNSKFTSSHRYNAKITSKSSD
jgi:hypothetical protein